MRAAVIDLGTNTFNLLIAELDAVGFRIVFSTKQAVKLGEGGITRRHIAEAAYKRGLSALTLYRNMIEERNVDVVYAFATSAIRSAENGPDFAKNASEILGVTIHVIDGDREAELIYKGVQLAVNPGVQPFLIMDIGGGSTEFIIAEKERMIWKKSFNLGVARLLERFTPSDPVTESDIQRIHSFLEETLLPLDEAMKTQKVDKLIGSSGSFDTFAEMICHAFYQPDEIDHASTYHFQLNDFDKIHAKLLTSTLQERLCMPGLLPMRTDMIVLASVFVKYILNRDELKEMHLSKYALKEGVIFELLQNGNLK